MNQEPEQKQDNNYHSRKETPQLEQTKSNKTPTAAKSINASVHKKVVSPPNNNLFASNSLAAI